MSKNNTSKNRKTEAQKSFEAADNAGRFAGNDTDAAAARDQAVENMQRDAASGMDVRESNESRAAFEREHTNADAHKDRAQTHDLKEEAQNVNDDNGRPMTDDEAGHASNKATEGMRQGREGK